MLEKNKLQINNEEIIPELVGKPFIEPFEIFIFNTKEKNIKIQTYDIKNIEALELNDFNNTSYTYCNGNNILYLSGGEKKNLEIINKLWIIDLHNNKQIQNLLLLSPKKYHSMIFIPDNHIFFIGGNDKNTFYYDIKNSQFHNWAELKKERIQPALINVSNYLYCFDNIEVEKDEFTLEKTDLNKNEPEWVLLKPIIGLNFKFPKYFGVAKNSDNKIIFLGGNIENNNEKNILVNYIYNIDKNEIEASNVPFINYNLKEKTFIKYNKSIYFILPDFNRENPEIIFYFKKKNKTEKINFKLNQNIQFSSINNFSLGPMNDLDKPIYIFQDSVHDSFFLDNSNIKTSNEINNIKNYKNDSINNSIKKNINNSNNENNNRLSDKNNKLKNKRPNSYRNPIFTRNNNYTNEIIVPKFHYHVNEPGVQIKILKENKVYNNYRPIEYTNSQKYKEDINKNGIMFLPNYKIYSNNNPFIQQKSNNSIKLNKNQKESDKNSKNENFKMVGIIAGINKSKNKNDNSTLNNDFKKNDFLLTGKIDGIDNKPRTNLDILNNKNTNLNIIKNQENNLDDIQIPDQENKPKIEINNPGHYIPNIEKFSIVTNIDIKSLSNKDNNSIINNNEENIEIKINPTKIDINHINNNLNNDNNNKLETKLNSNKSNIKINNENLPENNINNSITKQKSGQSNVEINKNKPKIKYESPIVNIDLNNQNKIEINSEKKYSNLKAINKGNKEFKLEGIITGFKSPVQNNRMNINIYENMLKENKKKTRHFRESSFETKGSRIIKNTYNFYNSSIDNKLNSNNNSIKNPSYRINGNIPSNKIKSLKRKTNLNIKNNSDFKMTGIIKGKNSKDLKRSNSIDSKNSKNNNKYKSPEIQINFEKSNTNLKNDINSNIKSPNNTLSPTSINIKNPGKNIDDSLYGKIEGIKFNSPKNGQFDYKLTGEIPGTNSLQKNSKIKSTKKYNSTFLFEGIIYSNKNKQKLDTKNDIKTNSPKINNQENNKEYKNETNKINNINENINNISENKIKQKNSINNALIESKKKLNSSNEINNDDKNSKNSNKMENINIKVINEQKNTGIVDIKVKSDSESNKPNINIVNSKNENDNFLNGNYGSMVIPNEINTFVNSSKRSTSQKKKGLPLVGSKNNYFELSKKEEGGHFDINALHLKNLKNSNVGVNGVKIGDRIIE